MSMEYEAIIGLEIHVQLNCATKMFCGCPNRPGDEPNRNTCPICLWFPGVIPQFSEEALQKATLTALAVNCEIQSTSAFDQKVYYYPDLPKGFQLSQFHKPLARNGWLQILREDGKLKKLRVRDIHMEEDVARLVHEVEGRTSISLVDFNRAGAPLVEIVTQPDMRTARDAMEFIRVLRAHIRYTGSSECSMEAGTMRVDANISLRERGTEEFNTKVEVKNMNSIHSVGEAIAYEIKRQSQCLESGEPVVLHTRLWNPEKRMTFPMRGKFEGPCIPDPSLPQVVIGDEWLKEMKSLLSEMPTQKLVRFVEQYGLTREEAALMSSERDLSEYFESVVKYNSPPRMTASWITTQLNPLLKERNQTFADTPVKPERFAELLAMVERDEVNAHAAKEVLQKLFESGRNPKDIVERGGFKQVSDTAQLESIVDKVIAENPSAVSDFRNGIKKAISFLIGQAMQASGGKANPKVIRRIVLSKLS